MKVRNVSPLGEMYIRGRIVAAGEVFEVADDLGARLLEQPANFVPVVAPKAKEANK